MHCTVIAIAELYELNVCIHIYFFVQGKSDREASESADLVGKDPLQLTPADQARADLLRQSLVEAQNELEAEAETMKSLSQDTICTLQSCIYDVVRFA